MIEIKVFISCPSRDALLGDLASVLVRKSEELNNYYEPLGFRIKPLYWDQPRFVGSEKGKTPQELIFEKAGDYDLYFGMMGSKYGNVLTGYQISPTEFEFNDALERNAKASLHKYPRAVYFSFVQSTREDCEEGQFEKIEEFRNRAWETGISREYKDTSEIIGLFVTKLIECINTTYIKYPLPDDYKIPLYVNDRKDAQDVFFRLYQKSLSEVITGKTRILLFGGGGSGKSTYLKYLAYHYSNGINTFTPIYLELKLYNATTLEESIISKTRSTPTRPLLLLDGYDELSDDLKLRFHRELRIWMDEHSDTPIVATSRPIDPSISPLRDYLQYDMSVLGHDQIKQYLTQNNINDSVFTSSPIWDELYPLLQIPFYLVKIVDFHKMTGELSASISEILESSIEHGTEGDQEHFETTFVAEYEYYELADTLSLLAFCMTNSGKSSISRKELSTLFPDKKIVDLLRRYTRLIKSERNQHGEVYSFSHKIFQDYLAAKAIHKTDVLSILKIITDSSEERISFNWESSIQFIFEGLEEQDRESLVQHILSVQPNLLLDVKPDLLSDDVKQKLFTATFEHYAATTQYMPRSINSRKLAAIWDSSSMERYLLAFIGNSRNQNNMIIEAFILLSYSKKVNKDLIDEALIASLQDDKLADYRRNLNNVATIFIKIDDFDHIILDELYAKNPRDTIQLLAVYDRSFKYVDELIDLYKEIDRKHRQNQSDTETMQSIEDYLVYCFKSMHLHEVVTSIINKKLLSDTRCLYDEMDEIVEYAYQNYKLEDIYEDMYRLFVYCIETGSDRHITRIGVYFIQQRVEYQVVKRIFDDKIESYFGVLLLLLNPDSAEFVRSICVDLIPGLSSPKKEQLLNKLANTQISPLYNEILEQQGINFEQYKMESIQERKKKRLIKDMDLVLNIDLLISELDDIFRDDDSITFEYSRSFGRYEICTVIDESIRDYRSNNPGECTIPKKSIILNITGSHQGLILDFVTSNFKKQPRINAFSDDVEIDLSPVLRNWLDNWKDEVLRNTDITTACKQKDPVRLEYDPRVEILWSLVKEDLVEVNNTTLLNFLSFVWDASEDWSVVEAKIGDKQQIRTRVTENLKNKHLLASNPLANHIWFCTNNHYYEVLPHSYDILKRLEFDYGKDKHLRYCCLESIIRIENNQNRFSNYVAECPIEILGYFARGFVKERRGMVGLIERLKTEVKLGESESTRLYLYYLVCMGDFEFLHKYIETIKQSRDFDIEYEYPNPFELITDETQLGLLLDLLSFSFENEIKESHYHSLKRCILTSIESIAYQSHENYEKTLGILTDLTKQNPKHNDTYVLYEYLWKLKEEMPKRTTKLPTLLESLELYNRINGSQDEEKDE